jgi:hypothetical protein
MNRVNEALVLIGLAVVLVGSAVACIIGVVVLFFRLGMLS